MKITIEIDDRVASLLAVLDNEQVKGRPAAEMVRVVVGLLIDHAQQGVYRPGSWERPWLCQVFGEDFIDRLEAADPPFFQRPRRAR